MTPVRVLVIGAGEAGRMAVREMREHSERGYVPVGFVDDNPAKQGAEFHGVRVLGSRDAIVRLAHDERVDEILIALPSVRGPVIRDIVRTCESARVHFRIVPGIWEIIRGDVRIDQIREVEPEDLLGRESVEIDSGAVAGYLTGKRVLVTGGGGSIGSEIARRVLPFRPAEVILLGKGENSLFETLLALESERGSEPSPTRITPVVGDAYDPAVLDRLFDPKDGAKGGAKGGARGGASRPDVVFHAAAHKHVHFMEAHPREAIRNNLLATARLVDRAIAAGSERFVMLSTDKAVNPRGVMGRTKRLAERVLQERARGAAAGTPAAGMPAAGGGKPATRLMAVRFGNVLGTRGSVVRVFQQQIRRGGPVTVTDPDVTRFFMTVKEAALLVIQAGALGEGGEVFLLDMGDPIRIADLAENLITLAGFEPGRDIAIHFTGLRPGEKASEDLLQPFEERVPTRFEKISVARAKTPPAAPILPRLGEIERAAETLDDDALRALLASLDDGASPSRAS